MSHPSDPSERRSKPVANWTYSGKPAMIGPCRHFAGWTVDGKPRTIRTKNGQRSTMNGQSSIGLERRSRAPPSIFELRMEDNYRDGILSMERPRKIDFFTRTIGEMPPDSHVTEAEIFLKKVSDLMPVGTVNPRSGTATIVSDYISGTHLHPWVTAVRRPKNSRKEPRARQIFVSVVEPPAWKQIELDVCVACEMERSHTSASTK
jgi:hypothetical protein